MGNIYMFNNDNNMSSLIFEKHILRRFRQFAHADQSVYWKSNTSDTVER